MPVTPDTFTNNAVSTVQGGAGGANTTLLATDTSLLLATGTGSLYPATGPFMLLLGSLSSAYELVKCTSRSTDTLTIVRATEDGTNHPAQNWTVGTPVEQIVSAGNLANLWALLANRNVGIYNARDAQYGAVGDGVTDDGPALRTWCAAVQAAGGGVMYLPAGTYYINSLGASPTDATKSHGFFVPSNTKVVGDGPGKTIIKLGPGFPYDTRIIENYQIASGTFTDVNITISDLCVDGNAANQTSTNDSHVGIELRGVRGVLLQNVWVRDVLGTTSSGNGPGGNLGEGMHIKCDSCIDVQHVGCTVYSTGASANTATGFSLNKCTSANYADCIVYGMGQAMGFTAWWCAQVGYSSCYAYNCASTGFNCEHGDGITYASCRSGGRTPNPLTSPATPSNAAPINFNTALPNNTGFKAYDAQNVSYAACDAGYCNLYGFYIHQASVSPGPALTGTVDMDGCVSHDNLGEGVWIDSTVVGSVVRVSSCRSINNGGTGFHHGVKVTNCAGLVFVNNLYATGNNKGSGGAGISIDSASLANVTIGGSNYLNGNNWQASIPAGNVSINGILSAPTVPATNVALTNPFARAVRVYITGGTVTAIKIGATTVATATSATQPVTLTLRAGDTITLTYSAAPTWIWQGE